MRWLELALAALGGGIVASIFDSWAQRLRDYETARLLIVGEVTGNLINSDHKTKEPKVELHWVTLAWTAYRDKLSPRLFDVDRETWLSIASFYEVILAEPALMTDPLSEDVREAVSAAVDRLKELTLGPLERLVAYGPTAVFLSRGVGD